jgi:hypothetical protein
MSEHDDEREAARRYRELPREEPSPALDAAIRAAARESVSRKGVRWYGPAAAAAMLVLAVAVTWQVERNKPEFVVATAPADSKLRKEQAPAASAPSISPAPASPSVAEPKAAESKPEKKPEPGAFARSKVQPAREAPAEQGVRQSQASDRLESANAAPPASRAAGARADAAAPRPLGSLGLDEAPEPWLKRIAELRRQGKDEDADRALAEFRKRYPDYAIPPGMLERVERK